MKMILFRPTFVTAGMVLSLVILLCSLVTSVSAAPQFGRPLLHALDELPAGSATSTVDLSAGTSTVLPTTSVGVSPSETPIADCATQDPEIDPVNVANPTESPTTVTSSVPPSTLAQTNGAPHLLGGVNLAIMLSVAFSASAVFIVF